MRVAVVGLGVGVLHIRAFRRLKEHFDIVAVCDRDSAKAAASAERLGCAAATSLGEVLGRDDVDVVDLCTPPFLHHEQIQAVLRSGRNAICEKPLVASVAEVDQLAELCRETGRWVMPVFQYRYGHGLQKLRRLVEAGLTGPLSTTAIEVSWLRDAEYFTTGWRRSRETALGGTVANHAVHAIDMLVHVAGPVRRVQATTRNALHGLDVEDSAAAVLELADGSLATLSATLGSVVEITRLRFCFERLVAESSTSPYTPSSEPWTFTPEPDVEPGPPFGPEQFEGQFGHLAEQRTPPVTLEDARRAIAVVEAIYRSAATGQAVEL